MTKLSLGRQLFSLGALLLIFSVLTVWAEPATTQNLQGLYDRAARSYEAGQYEQAIREYNLPLDQGLESGPLYFNLGNCFLKKGELGRAILNYERAKRLIPLDSDLDSNLKYARLLSGNNQQSDRGTVLLDRWFEWVSIDGLTLLLSALYTVSILLLMAGISLPKMRRWVRGAFPILVILSLLSLLGLAGKISLSGEEAVILDKRVEAKIQPFDRAPVSFMLEEGTKVRVLQSSRDWVKVRLSKEKTGWVKASGLELI